MKAELIYAKNVIEPFDVIFLFQWTLFQKYRWMTCKSRHCRLNGWRPDDVEITSSEASRVNVQLPFVPNDNWSLKMKHD